MKIEYTETFADYSKTDFEKIAADEGMTIEEYYKTLDENFERLKINNRSDRA